MCTGLNRMALGQLSVSYITGTIRVESQLVLQSTVFTFKQAKHNENLIKSLFQTDRKSLNTSKTRNDRLKTNIRFKIHRQTNIQTQY